MVIVAEAFAEIPLTMRTADVPGLARSPKHVDYFATREESAPGRESSRVAQRALQERADLTV